jgi:hypothetical protein
LITRIVHYLKINQKTTLLINNIVNFTSARFTLIRKIIKIKRKIPKNPPVNLYSLSIPVASEVRN